jgi:hypothetical protein
MIVSIVCVAARYAHQYVLDSGLLFHETYTGVPRFTYLDFAEGFVSTLAKRCLCLFLPPSDQRGMCSGTSHR